MELELKHIAAYLPYDLKAQSISTKQVRIVTWTHFSYNIQTVGINHLICEGLLLDKHKPILRPLSMYCGKMIAKDAMKLLNCDVSVVHEIWELQDGTKSLDQISVKTYNVMCENHVDFDRLIDANLAVDINTLNQ